MSEFILENQGAIRLGLFFGGFVVLALAESALPRREAVSSRKARWPANLAIAVIGAVALRLIFGLGAAGAALYAQKRGLGLLNALALPAGVPEVMAFLALDFTVYAQHVLFHRVSLFWRFHRMHHTDADLDVTSANRFHPIEYIISMIIKIAAAAALGAPPAAVLAFEALLNLTSMFNHANVAIPAKIDAALRLWVVTPDMHRVHHSVILKELNSNYGFNLPWWDRIFRTYRAQPERGHLHMPLGLAAFHKAKTNSLAFLLAAPFKQG